MTCDVGIAERSERLVVALVATGFAGLFHAPWIQAAGLTAAGRRDAGHGRAAAGARAPAGGGCVRDVRGEASDLAFAAGWSALRRMPAPMAGATFRGLADQAWLRHGKSVQQLEKNLRRVVPDASTRELRELSRESMRSYMRYWCEAFRLPDLTHEEIVASHTCVGEENIVQGVESGRGAIMTLAHSGNWDHAGAWLALAHGRFTTVAERLRARVPVRAVPELPPVAGHGGAAADR